MKGIIDTINEARDERYDVQFVGFKHTVTIMVPARQAIEFEEYAQQHEGDIFSHVQGDNIEF